MLRYIFEELDATSIFGECNALNPASARVMEKAGMKLAAEDDDADGDRALRYELDREGWQKQVTT